MTTRQDIVDKLKAVALGRAAATLPKKEKRERSEILVGLTDCRTECFLKMLIAGRLVSAAVFERRELERLIDSLINCRENMK